MKNLIIIEDCRANGKHVARGEVIEADDRTTYTLIAAGRALDLETKEGKQIKADIEAEKEEAAKAKAKVEAEAKNKDKK